MYRFFLIGSCGNQQTRVLAWRPMREKRVKAAAEAAGFFFCGERGGNPIKYYCSSRAMRRGGLRLTCQNCWTPRDMTCHLL
jgi:hypothetical protein